MRRAGGVGRGFYIRCGGRRGGYGCEECDARLMLGVQQRWVRGGDMETLYVQNEKIYVYEFVFLACTEIHTGYTKVSILTTKKCNKMIQDSINAKM